MRKDKPSLLPLTSVNQEQPARVSFDQLEWLQSQLNLTNREMAKCLPISVSTLSTWRKERRPVTTPLIAEQVRLLVSLAEHGNQIFRKLHGFSSWLRQPQWDLQDGKPLDFLSSPEGIHLVSAILVRIEHGLPL